jgi:hypothetical protein
MKYETVDSTIKSSELVSIVIPVYNVENYLTRCINSILTQSHSCIEIVLVDDGSTDASGEMCDEYASRDSRVVVVHQTNQGLSAARNTGINQASGNWVMFVDSDDYIEPVCVKWLLQACLLTSSELSMCNFVTQREDDYPDSRFHHHSFNEHALDVFSSTEAVCQILSEKKASTTACGKLGQIELWNRHPFPEGRCYEDLPITWRVASEANKVAHVPESLYRYTLRQGSIARSFSTQRILDYHESIVQMLHEVSDQYKGSTDVINCSVFRACLEYSRLLDNFQCVSTASNNDETEEIRVAAMQYLRNNWRDAFSVHYASIAQRARIFLTALAPGLAFNLRRWLQQG